MAEMVTKARETADNVTQSCSKHKIKLSKEQKDFVKTVRALCKSFDCICSETKMLLEGADNGNPEVKGIVAGDDGPNYMGSIMVKVLGNEPPRLVFKGRYWDGTRGEGAFYGGWSTTRHRWGSDDDSSDQATTEWTPPDDGLVDIQWLMDQPNSGSQGEFHGEV